MGTFSPLRPLTRLWRLWSVLAFLASSAFATSATGLTVLATGDLSARPAKLWIVVGQEADCAEAMRVARRRARANGVHPMLIPVVLDRTKESHGALLPSVTRAIRMNFLAKALWLRGVRSTPTIVEVTAGKVTASVSPLAGP